jgi:hypothetical protein
MKLFGFCFTCWNTGHIDCPDGLFWYGYCKCDKGKHEQVTDMINERNVYARGARGVPRRPPPSIK